MQFVETRSEIEVNETAYSVEAWLPHADIMRLPNNDPYVAIDTETEKLIPGMPVKPVIMQVCSHALRRIQIVPWQHIEDYLVQFDYMHRHVQYKIVMHNCPFDLHVLGVKRPRMAFLMQMVEDFRIIDTGIRFILHRLSIGAFSGTWNLAFVANRMLGIEIAKDDELRLTFKQDMLLTPEHMTYAAVDSAVTAQLLTVMPNPFPTELIQICGYMALSDISRTGLMVDIEYMRRLRDKIEKENEEHAQVLSCWGYRINEPGNTKVLQHLLGWLEGEIRWLKGDHSLRFNRTKKTDMIQTTDDSLAIMGSHPHPFLHALKELLHGRKMVSTYMKESLIGRDNRVHSNFSPLVKTGRTSSARPNIQNIPRKGGIRGMYLAPVGHLFYACDYAQLELCSLADTCYLWYGESVMRDVINSGTDVHQWFASRIMDVTLEDVTDDQRQMAKACYSADTELLTSTGWARIEGLYNTEVSITQYCPHTKALTFFNIKPDDWVKQEDKTLYEFESHSMNCCVTADHRMLAISHKGRALEIQARDYKANTALFSVHGGKLAYDRSILREAHTRLAVLLNKRGLRYTDVRGEVSIRIECSTSRVKELERCRLLLEAAAVTYSEREPANRVVQFLIRVPEEVRKLLSMMSSDRMGFRGASLLSPVYDTVSFLDEIKWWSDAPVRTNPTYTSYYYQDADFVQTILVTSGYRASISLIDGDTWSVSWSNGIITREDSREFAGLRHMTKKALSGKHTVYCPRVYTSWVLTRRKGHVTVQGNCNFGFPGGLGAATFQKTAMAQYGVDIAIDRCKELKEIWLDSFPEMQFHLKPKEDPGIYRSEGDEDVEDEEDLDAGGQKKSKYIARTATGRIRRNATYCSACNYPFQGGSSDGAKVALWLMYKDNIKVVNFIHDETISELPDDPHLQDRVKRIDYLMVKGMQMVIKNVRIKVEGALMRRWYKEAKPVVVDGKLLEWVPTTQKED